MEVRNGYKQTDIGVLPKDWDCGLLDQNSHRGSGHTPNKKIKEYYDGDIVWVSLADSDKLDRGYINSSATKISKKGISNSSATLHPKGVVLMSRDAGIGKSAVAECDLCVSQHFITWFCNEKTLHNWFLYFWLQYQKKEFERIAMGSTIKTIGLPFFRQYKVPLPKYTEQTAIATALSDTDALITSLEKLIAKKRNIKQGAMQELLKPKKGWEVKRLGDLTKTFTKQTGFDYTAYIKPSLTRKKTEKTIPFIQNKDFNNKFINMDTDYFIPTRVAKMFPQILLNEKSLLISISGSIGNIGVYDSDQLAFIGGAVAILKFNNPDLIDWILYYLKSNDGQNKLFKNVKAGSHQNLILDDIRKVEICFPSRQEQILRTGILSDMDSEIIEIECKLEKYKQIKSGMMQNLLTGKIRLV